MQGQHRPATPRTLLGRRLPLVRKKAASVKEKTPSNAVNPITASAREVRRLLAARIDGLITPLGTEKMFGFWLAAAEGTLLGLDTQRVIALRAMKIAAGGSSARSEVSRMMTEKVSAAAEAVAILTRGGSGRRVIRRYRTRVRTNVRRLSRPRG